jgi:hypothetical protein
MGHSLPPEYQFRMPVATLEKLTTIYPLQSKHLVPLQ